MRGVIALAALMTAVVAFCWGTANWIALMHKVPVLMP